MISNSILPADYDFEDVIPLWKVNVGEKKLTRQFTFQHFIQAFEFMTHCASYAEELNHHPDWSNSWNIVKVELSTHSAGALTELDIKMASFMDAMALLLETKSK
ncbi:4a-hydroxytetrahydrobiopterin dehydratase [Polynucleobacter asymbioticus]|uniref:4a-hydroxytetrahydrobiopterin dehydratase n=1 Tax=Polynucleobacter asymbioticus TaxID=576611 RepID=A0AAC9NI49_9BURK|nr:4a-hydroxytetrahydrobiopterin dehydratase [Polynucleobacter asymbioticus]APB98267.1 pterin dehydratase [Polynucleobacter asymbioticus]APC00552.1 pterin dehydratase [Polynucleobacter asymbioticus]